MVIKKGSILEIPEMQKLFVETVLSVNTKDYSLKQVEAWASCVGEVVYWEKRFDEFQFFVCYIKEELVGFVSVNKVGFIHSLFISKNHQRKGVAKELMKNAEQFACNSKAKELTSEVSITAKPFFEKNGFETIEKQNATAKDVVLINYKMRKSI